LQQESKAGLAVGKLRAHDSKEVSDLAKEIVKKWKNEVERAKGGSGSKTPANGKPPGAFIPCGNCRTLIRPDSTY